MLHIAWTPLGNAMESMDSWGDVTYSMDTPCVMLYEVRLPLGNAMQSMDSPG